MDMSGNRDYNYKMDEAEMEIKLTEVSVPHPSEKIQRIVGICRTFPATGE